MQNPSRRATSRADPNPLTSTGWLWAVERFVPEALRAEGGERLIRARILAGTSLVGGMLTGGLGLVELGAGRVHAVSVSNLVGGIAIFGAALLLRRTGSLFATANLLVATGWLMNSSLYVWSDGTNASTTYAYAMVPLIAMLIGGLKVGAFWTVICCLSALYAAEMSTVAFGAPLGGAALGTSLARDVVTLTIWLALVGAVFDRVWAHAQRSAERAQRLSEEGERRFALFFEANPDGILLADAGTGRILECNAGLLELFGESQARVARGVAWPSALGMGAEQLDAVEKALDADGRSGEVEVRLAAPPGDDRSLRLRAARFEVDGRACVLATVRDVSEHTRLEAQLRQSQKMEAVGQLAGSIAHDFNNMLTVISGYAEHLADTLEGQHRAMASEIRSAAGRSADLTRHLLAFSRRQVLEPQVIDPNERIGQLETLLERLIGGHIEIELALASSVGAVRADPGQLEQVIVNLAINARDAMPGGGTLRIETARFAGRPPGSERDGNWVRLDVRDTGHGMDESTLEQAFEPFFTTKDTGKGTGLGLSMVEGTVRQSGGELSILSDLDQGTTVSIFLPRLEIGSEDSRERRAASDPGAVPGQTILLVEDDDQVRRLAHSTLHQDGYRVLEAADGVEALELFRDHGDDVDLVLTDLVMPRCGGVELARRLREIRRVPLLFISGHPNPRDAPSMEVPEFAEVIQKPFSAEGLRARVNERLGRVA